MSSAHRAKAGVWRRSCEEHKGQVPSRVTAAGMWSKSVKSIPSILAIEPDPGRAKALTQMVHDCVDAKVVVSASADVAMAVMGRRMPDLILLSALAPPGEEQKLVTFLRQAHGGWVPVLFVSPVVDAPGKRAFPGFRSLLRGGQPGPAELMRVGLAARIEAALQRSPAQTLTPTEEFAACVPRARRWSPNDVAWLSDVRLSTGIVGHVVNISNSGMLIQSEFALMPGNSVTFELCRPAGKPAATGHPLMVPAHIVRSEVSKVGPDELRYLVAAKFCSDLELLPETLAGGTAVADFMVATGHSLPRAEEALQDLARALEGFESAIARMASDKPDTLARPS